VAVSFYNTLTKKKEEFVPIEKGRVKIYACGITVYDLCHIGHARSAVVFDVLVRYLQSKGFSVTYVRNITDVDDKIINKANEEKTDWKTIAERYIKEFYIDMGPFDLLKPTVEPKATDHIQEMISLIDILVNKGMAYESGGDVYFSVEKFKEYGKLSGAKLSEMQAQEGVPTEGGSENKRNRLDFTLWKKSKPGEPTWESPWGSGRPGWHIECSAMSMKYLGETLDIHGGGMDLIFPHHENEIAQSEGATGKPFARFWIHNGFVNINREKMSKSLGNIFTLREALKRWHPEAIRYFLLSSHYRSPVDFTPDAIESCFDGLIRAYASLQNLDYDVGSSEDKPLSPPQIKDSDLRKEVEPLLSLMDNINLALDDDLNTPVALSHLFNAISVVYKYGGRQSKDKLIKGILKYGKAQIIHASKILGILREKPEEFLRFRRYSMLEKLGIGSQKIKELDIEIRKRISSREKAREDKKWNESDAIRLELLYDGIYLEDTPQGTRRRNRGEIYLTLEQYLPVLQNSGQIEAHFYSNRVIPDILFIQNIGKRKLLIPMGSAEDMEKWIHKIEDSLKKSNIKDKIIYLLTVPPPLDRTEINRLYEGGTYNIIETWYREEKGIDRIINRILEL